MGQHLDFLNGRSLLKEDILKLLFSSILGMDTKKDKRFGLLPFQELVIRQKEKPGKTGPSEYGLKFRQKMNGM